MMNVHAGLPAGGAIPNVRPSVGGGLRSGWRYRNVAVGAVFINCDEIPTSR